MDNLRKRLRVVHFEHLLVNLPDSPGLCHKRHQAVKVAMSIFVVFLEYRNVLHLGKKSIARLFDHLRKGFSTDGRGGSEVGVRAVGPGRENAFGPIPLRNLSEN